MPDKIRKPLSEEQKAKARARAIAYRKAYPEKIVAANEVARLNEKRKRVEQPHLVKDAKLRYRYEIGISDYQAMMDQQGNACLICGRVNEVLAVDHCHATGNVRGLLCGTCNRALGLMEDRSDWLENAVRYLRAG